MKELNINEFGQIIDVLIYKSHLYKDSLKRVASDDMQDSIACLKQFDSEEELKKYMANMKSGEGKRGTFEDMFGDLFS